MIVFSRANPFNHDHFSLKIFQRPAQSLFEKNRGIHATAGYQGKYNPVRDLFTFMVQLERKKIRELPSIFCRITRTGSWFSGTS
jgi:hypothetical protein